MRADNPGVDHVVVGEAEETAAALVADMEAGRVRPLYEAPRFPDLSLTPLPRWDLIDLREYATMSVQSCRGCPFDCEFCDVVALNGHKPRYKSPARFLAELDAPAPCAAGAARPSWSTTTSWAIRGAAKSCCER